jgi:nucleoside-diphosphate-sugar epimerase
MIYQDQGTRIATEETPVEAANERFRVVLEMEQMVRGSALDWCILRGGAFYGPGTGREEEWRTGMRDGTLRMPGDGSALVSLIRVADMAGGTVAAVERAPARSTYNVVDDEPVTYRELFHWLAAQMGRPAPPAGGPPLASTGCSNAKLRDLGWLPGYATYRSGLAI